METHTLVDYLTVALFALCCTGGVVSWAFVFHYMFRTMNGFRPDRRWGRFLPISLLIPWFFTDEGNAHRIKLIYALAGFAFFCGSGIAIGFINLK